MTDSFIAVTEGAGKNIAADQRTLGGTSVQIQRTLPTGNGSFATSQATVTTTSGSILAAQEGRSYVTVTNWAGSAGDFDVGPSGVAAGSGYRLAPGQSIDLPTTAAIHADAYTVSCTALLAEFYD